jgi:hypothetical protein
MSLQVSVPDPGGCYQCLCGYLVTFPLDEGASSTEIGEIESVERSRGMYQRIYHFGSLLTGASFEEGF